MKENPKIIVSGKHVELTEAIKQSVYEKAERLFRHESQIVRLRVEVDRIDAAAKEESFSARGKIEIHGPDLVASATHQDLYKAILMMVERLDSMLSKRSCLMRVKRRHPHRIEFPVSLPKAVATAR